MQGNTYTTFDPQVKTPVKTPELELVRDELEKAVDELVMQVGGLEARLQTVLLPEVSSNPVVEGKDAMHSQVVAQLRVILEKLYGISRNVEQIKSRLEI